MNDQQKNDIVNWVYAALHACRDARVSQCAPVIHSLATLTVAAGENPFWRNAQAFPCLDIDWLSTLRGCLYHWGPFMRNIPPDQMPRVFGTDFVIISAESEVFDKSAYYQTAYDQITSFLVRLDFSCIQQIATTWACCSRIMFSIGKYAELKRSVKLHLDGYGSPISSTATPLVPDTLLQVGELFVDLLRMRGKHNEAANLAKRLGISFSGTRITGSGTPVFGLS